MAESRDGFSVSACLQSGEQMSRSTPRLPVARLPIARMTIARCLGSASTWAAAVALFLSGSLSGSLLAADPVAGTTLSFNKDIRPILVENCFSCHGADSAGRKAELRLDQRDVAVESGAIVPGDTDSSVMLDRIFSDDPDEMMPPPAHKKTLTSEQKEMLRRWIAEGAAYEPHWSFLPPQRPDLPAVKNEAWIRNPIDRFILARLESEGLTPAPEADRRYHRPAAGAGRR
jgi:Planctomycete cytochrome C